jgi:signal transduction histidine kinase
MGLMLLLLCAMGFARGSQMGEAEVLEKASFVPTLEEYYSKPTVETTAYYIVAEALTNVAKHSRATEAHVVIQRDNGNLRIDIVDDGVGGASPSPGSGLSGLKDRVDALDGSLEISSPVGGPTRISARLPCES